MAQTPKKKPDIDLSHLKIRVRRSEQGRQQEPVFKKTEYGLPETHSWRSAPGYSICVMGRGDLRFEYPAGWVHKPTQTSLKFHNVPYPHDSIVLEVSVLKLPGVIDWKTAPDSVQPGVTLVKTLQAAGHRVTPDQIRQETFPGVVFHWLEYEAPDTENGKPTIWRQGHCSPVGVYTGHTLLGIMTLGYYLERKADGEAIWQNLLRSTVMGDYTVDPIRGPRLN